MRVAFPELNLPLQRRKRERPKRNLAAQRDQEQRTGRKKEADFKQRRRLHKAAAHVSKLTWLVLGEDPAARSRRVEQFTAL